ncbi:hypothetical protein C2E23DRAFT_23803 [Lenzites betulinus]|nr:hypothetical protein C2E23DRAFT_23803 [Lenzites betulinus]
MPVAELIAVVELGGQAVKFLIKLQPTKVLDKALALEHEAMALIAADDLKGLIHEEQRQVLEGMQARIERQKQGLPNTLTVKEIIKRPKVLLKARELHTVCAEFLNTARWITSSAMAERLAQTGPNMAANAQVHEDLVQTADTKVAEEPPTSTTTNGGRGNAGMANDTNDQEDGYVHFDFRRTDEPGVQKTHMRLNFRVPRHARPGGVQVAIPVQGGYAGVKVFEG